MEDCRQERAGQSDVLRPEGDIRPGIPHQTRFVPTGSLSLARYVMPDLYDRIKGYREEFHRYPEVSWTEYRTSWQIAKRLRELGYEVFIGADVCEETARMGLPSSEFLQECERRARAEGVPEEMMKQMSGGRTGVVGVLKGGSSHESGGDVNTAGTGGFAKESGRKCVVALRFDIDALAIEEERTDCNADYRSLHEGTMHACGHDGHAAAGLGVAEVLAIHREELRGEVRLIFQPAEEGCHGAAAIVDKGWLDDVDLFLSGHIGISCRKPGEIAACSGGFLATSKLDFHFKGKSAHAGKAPGEGRNALLAAARFTVDAYDLVRGREGVLVNVGKFVGGSGRNIIAADAWLEAETRGATQAQNQGLCRQVIETAQDAGRRYGVEVEAIKIGEAGTGSSSPRIARACKAYAREMGMEAGYQEDADFGASEDVTLMMERVQSRGGEAAFFMFGTTLGAEHHHGAFDFDTEVLGVMVEFYARAVMGTFVGDGKEVK